MYRQFTAALADLHEATRLCPNNREIRRLLARVEDECKQMQRAQNKQQGALNPSTTDHESDHEREEGEEEDSTENSLGRDLDEEDSSQLDARAEPWSQNIYQFNRTLPDSVGNCQQTSRPGSPPHRQSQRQHQREPVAQKSLILQPTKQAQIVKTNQHLSSPQSGSTQAPPTKSQTHAPSSPLPERHMLKAGPGIDISPLLPPSEGKSHSSTATGQESEGVLLSQAYSSSSSSRAPERLSAHSVSSLEALSLSASSGALGQGQGQELRKESAQGAGSGSQTGSMRVSSSTSSLASSSSLSDSGKLQGPDVRTKTTMDKTKSTHGGTVEYKPRPFMGIMDKTARFQQQQCHQSRGWQSHSSDSHSTSSAGLVGANCEFTYPKPSSTYHEQLKASSQGAALGSLHNGSLHAKEFTDKFCQAATCYKESKPAVAMAHSYTDSKPKHPSLARDNPAIHVASMKPKRSFIESNV